MPIALAVFFLLAVLIVVSAGALIALSAWFASTWLRFYRYHKHKGLVPPDGATWGARIRAWIAEGLAIVRMLTFKLEWGPSALPAGVDPGAPVVCIHGFTQDRTNFSAIRGTLWRGGRSSVSINLGLPGRAPTRYAPSLALRLAAVLDDHPEGPIDLVCHSMGGVLLRQVLSENEQLRHRIRTVITLGSPHHGTAATRGPLRLMPEGRGLHRRSQWITELPDFRDLLPHARTITVAGGADYVVYPMSTCHLPGSEAVNLPEVGHAGLLVEPRVLALIDAALLPAPDEPEPSSSASR